MRCRCGFVYTGPHEHSDQPSNSIYTREYYTPWELDKGAQSPSRISKTATFTRWLDTIEKFHSGKGKLLDVGCATGIFLEIAANRNWDVYGVEISEFASSEAAKKFSGRIVYGTLNQLPSSTGFDVITCFDVIEHINDPRSFICTMAGRLVPGGILALSTVDMSSLSRRLFGKTWWQYKPEHCSYFSRALLSQLLHTTGLNVISISSAGKKLNPAFIFSYFQAYRSSLISPFVNLLYTIVPIPLRMHSFSVPTGEMLVIARRV